MKKVTIAVLMLLVLGATSLFAVQIVNSSSSSSDMYDYLGLNIGYGVTNEKYNPFADVERVDKGYQLGLSLNDFMFFSRDVNVGFYMEMGMSFNVKTECTEGGVPTGDDKISPFFSDLVLGFAFKADVDKRTSVLVGVGPELMIYSKEYKGFPSNYERDFLVLGAGLDLEGTYKVANDVYIGIGFRGSIMFYGTMIDRGRYGEKYTKYDNYFGYRVLPRFSVYLGL